MAADNFLWFPEPATGGLLKWKSDQPLGESTDKFFSTKKAMELSSISFGVAQAETVGSGSTGASAGKAKFEEFTIEKGVDLASVPLYVACCAGAHFPSVMLAIRKAGGSNMIYVQYIFRRVFVTGINWSGGSGEELCKETVKFRYGAMGIQYAKQKPDGQPDTPIAALWTAVNNKPTLDVQGMGAAPPFLGPGAS
jgi:type VI protein secretion system component Hcp